MLDHVCPGPVVLLQVVVGGGALQPLCTMNVTGGPPLAADHLHKGPTISSLWGTDLHEHQAQGSAQGQ